MLSVKLHDLKLKTRPKQLIGFLPLVIALPAYGNYPICAEGDQGKKGIHPRDTITPMVLLTNFTDEKKASICPCILWPPWITLHKQNLSSLCRVAQGRQGWYTPAQPLLSGAVCQMTVVNIYSPL